MISQTKTYIAFHKAYGVLSQFTKELQDHITLLDYFGNLPKDVYPVGRLDKDSEGLLILTNDKKLTDYLLNPINCHPRKYLVQVDGEIYSDDINRLEQGVNIRYNKKSYTTLPCKVIKVDSPSIDPRNPPIRFRKNIPTNWLEITLTEGKNRQVRRMCAAIGFPVLRLIRIKIGKLPLNSLELGKYNKVSLSDIL